MKDMRTGFLTALMEGVVKHGFVLGEDGYASNENIDPATITSLEDLSVVDDIDIETDSDGDTRILRTEYIEVKARLYSEEVRTFHWNTSLAEAITTLAEGHTVAAIPALLVGS